MQIAPAAETGTAQDATDSGRTESGWQGDVIGGTLLPAQLDDVAGPSGRNARTAVRPRGSVV